MREARWYSWIQSSGNIFKSTLLRSRKNHHEGCFCNCLQIFVSGPCLELHRDRAYQPKTENIVSLDWEVGKLLIFHLPLIFSKAPSIELWKLACKSSKCLICRGNASYIVLSFLRFYLMITGVKFHLFGDTLVAT